MLVGNWLHPGGVERTGLPQRWWRCRAHGAQQRARATSWPAIAEAGHPSPRLSKGVPPFLCAVPPQHCSGRSPWSGQQGMARGACRRHLCRQSSSVTGASSTRALERQNGPATLLSNCNHNRRGEGTEAIGCRFPLHGRKVWGHPRSLHAWLTSTCRLFLVEQLALVALVTP